MLTVLIIVHVILCIALIFLVLLQQGKGADLGAVFGNSNSLFGAGGAGAGIGKVTTILAVVFMVTSILLVRAFIAQKSDMSSDVTAMAEQEAAAKAESENDKLDGSVLNDIVVPKADSEEKSDKVSEKTNKEEDKKAENNLPQKVN